MPIAPNRKMERLNRERRRQDPYRSQMKPRGTPRCPSCGSVNVAGRWVPSQNVKPEIMRKVKAELWCPACSQQRDGYAGGVVEIRGERAEMLRDEALRTLRNTETMARLRNDQQRIVSTRRHRNVLKIYVTLPELARRMGRELEKAFQGVTEYARSTEEPYLRVQWWSERLPVGHEPGAALAQKRKKLPTSSSAAKRRGSSRPGRSRRFRGRG